MKIEKVDFVQIIMHLAEVRNPVEEGDWLDEEGLLMCGKCNTRRQMIKDFPDPDHPGQTIPQKVFISCQCRAEAFRKREEEGKRRKEQERIARLKQNSLMDYSWRKISFEHFQEIEQNRKNLKLCKRYVEHFDEMFQKNQGLWFYGASGTGKTFMAACIANALLDKGQSVIMTSFVRMVNYMQSAKEPDYDILERLNWAKLLILDDLGAERSTTTGLEKVYSLIDSRYRAQRPLILTTNLSPNDMLAVSDLRYARIYDRIYEMCYAVPFTDQPWRKIEAAQRFEAMQKFLEDEETIQKGVSK